MSQKIRIHWFSPIRGGNNSPSVKIDSPMLSRIQWSLARSANKESGLLF